MNDNAGSIGIKRLRDITLPGTHDSGTYAYSGMSQPTEWAAIAAMIGGVIGYIVSWPVALAFTITQDRTIAQQLTDGIRYLDIRSRASNGSLHIVHGPMPLTPKVVSGNGTTESTKGVIQDVRDFVAAHAREIVVLDFQEFQDMTAADYTTLFTTIQTELEGYLVPTTINGTPTLSTSLNTIWGNNPTTGKVIVLFDQTDASLIAASGAWNSTYFWNRDAYMASPWANTDDSDDLRNFLYLGNPTHLISAGKWPVLQGQLTTVTHGSIFTSLHDAAVSNNPQVMSWLTTGRLGTHWNIVILDYYDQGGITYVSTVASLAAFGWPSWTGNTNAFWGGNTTVAKLGSINKAATLSPSPDSGTAAGVLGGKLYVFYRDSDTSLLHMVTYDGTTWTGDTAIPAITEAVDGPPGVVAFTKSSKSYLMLVYKVTGHDTLREVFFDGTDWSGVAKPGMKSSQSPGLATYSDGNGNAMVLMAYKDNGSDDLKWAQYTVSAGTWNDRGTIASDSSISPQSDCSPAVVSYGGKVYMFYTGATFDTLYQSIFDPSTSTWSGNVTISSLPGGINPASDTTPAVANFAGKIFLVYESASLDDVYVATWDGTTWSGNTEIEDAANAEIDPSTDEQPALASFGGALYLFYKGWASESLYVSALGAFHTWSR
jgi:hypothetical protein